MKKILSMMVLALVALTAQAQQATDMARGADVSWCTEMEAAGRKFYNANGQECELMALMKEIGMTAIRLRVWVNPSQYGYGAWSDKADVLVKAKRAKAAGLDLMIDFHYSDFFADPSTQTTPLDWQGKSLDEMKTAVTDHTKDVLNALKDEGIEPKWVQVGNETPQGMIWNTGKVVSNNFTNYVALSNAGYDAVKDVFPNAQVIVHQNDAYSAANSNCWFFRGFKTAGGKFDMIGFSHYPTSSDWNSETSGKVSNYNAAKSVSAHVTQFSVPVMICETGFDVSKPALASTVMKDLFKRMKAIPQCAGIFYWEPETDGQWKPDYYKTIEWKDDNGTTQIGWNAYENGAFTTDGKPTAALDAFSGKESEETSNFPSELKVYDENGANVLTTLSQTSEGVYTGQLNATVSWLNFYVVDVINEIWYGTVPNVKTSISSASGHWKFWIDSSQTGVYDIEVNLNTMTWTHTYNAEASAIDGTYRVVTSEPAKYYDLSGRPIRSSYKGVTIERRGTEVRKVLQ